MSGILPEVFPVQDHQDLGLVPVVLREYHPAELVKPEDSQTSPGYAVVRVVIPASTSTGGPFHQCAYVLRTVIHVCMHGLVMISIVYMSFPTLYSFCSMN